MMDLSDGLSTDLPRLCVASQVGACIHAEKLPKLRAADIALRLGKNGVDPQELALNGGEDYELLFTVPSKKRHLIPPSHRGAHITAIGEITKKRDIVLVGKDGRRLPFGGRGWDPFRKGG